MSLDRATSVLSLLKSAAKIVPGVGNYLEAVVDAALEVCKYAKDVKSNKVENRDLTERAVRCLAVVIEKMQGLPESEVNKQMSTIGEFKGLIDDLVRVMKQRAQRRLPSRVWHKSEDKEEIEGLRKRLDEVIERFGLQAQLAVIYDIEDAIRRIKELQIAQEQMNKNQMRADQTALLNTLRPVMNARHDHPDAPKGCTKDTRIDVLNLMFQWAINQLAAQTIFWLSGLAGTGKSAIMKTLSEMLAKEGILGGCFFVSIKSADRRDPQNIIRTLAYQLAELQPVLREPICSVIRDSPLIVDQDMALQAPKLLADTFTSIQSQIERPIVIMIDALDECEEKDNIEDGHFLRALLDVILHNSAKLKLVITSRPTPTIRSVMKAIVAEQLRLHEIEGEKVAGDIEIYLRTKFKEITRSRNLENEPTWYTDKDIAELVRRAGNLFIFASTIVMWVSSPFHLPKDRLRWILKSQPLNGSNSPYKPLDSLYEAVLRAALGPNPEEHDEIGKRVQRLLMLLVVAFRPLLVSEIAMILGYEEGIVQIDLGNLSAVLVVPEVGVAKPVVIHHASFVGFITGESQCPSDSPFHVAVKDAHGQVGTWCLDLCLQQDNSSDANAINKSNSDKQDLPSYALEQWYSHFERSSLSPDYVLEATQKVEQAINKNSGNIKLLLKLSDLLFIQIQRTDKIEYLHKKIQVDRQTLELATSSQDTSRDSTLIKLALGLHRLYERSGKKEDLDEAIKLNQEALKLRPQGHSKRDEALNNLANGLRRLYEWSGKQEHLVEAIRLYQEALELRLQGHPYRDFSLGNLAAALQRLYERSGKKENLDEAIKLNREALKLRLQGHPRRDETLNNLANGLKRLYEWSGKQGDLDEAIKLYREALELRPQGHPKRDSALNNLAAGLQRLYERSRKQEDVDEAIKLNQEALELRLQGHPKRDETLNNLANGFKSLYERSRKHEDLDNAIKLYREALELRPQGHPKRDSALNNLANGLLRLYDRSRKKEDLDEAIKLHQEALGLRLQGHPRRDETLNNLANGFKSLYEGSRKQEDLDEAIKLYQDALELRPQGHPYRDETLNNLANGLQRLYERSRKQEDLDEAIKLNQEAHSLCPQGHPF